MASANFALPPAARCERPSQASFNAVCVHVGGLAQGPEEKRGLAGRDAGYSIAINAILSDMRPSLGKGVPLAGLPNCPSRHKSRNVGIYINCSAARLHSEPIGNFSAQTTDLTGGPFLRIGRAQTGNFILSHITLDERMHLAAAAHQSGVNLIAPINAQRPVECTLARINRNCSPTHRG